MCSDVFYYFLVMPDDLTQIRGKVLDFNWLRLGPNKHLFISITYYISPFQDGFVLFFKLPGGNEYFPNELDFKNWSLFALAGFSIGALLLYATNQIQHWNSSLAHTAENLFFIITQLCVMAARNKNFKPFLANFVLFSAGCVWEYLACVCRK